MFQPIHRSEGKVILSLQLKSCWLKESSSWTMWSTHDGINRKVIGTQSGVDLGSLRHQGCHGRWANFLLKRMAFQDASCSKSLLKLKQFLGIKKSEVYSNSSKSIEVQMLLHVWEVIPMSRLRDYCSRFQDTSLGFQKHLFAESLKCVKCENKMQFVHPPLPTSLTEKKSLFDSFGKEAGSFGPTPSKCNFFLLFAFSSHFFLFFSFPPFILSIVSLFLPLSIFFFTQLLLFFCTLLYLYTCESWLTQFVEIDTLLIFLFCFWMDCESSSWIALKASFASKLLHIFW